MDSASLPFLTQPHDAIRQGLVTLKDGASKKHPVEELQSSVPGTEERSKMQMLKNVYGSGLPARMQIEKQILQRVGRLPGLPSSRVGLQSLTGELDRFGFESYLNLPGDSVQAPPDLHSLMEEQLGMGVVTRPAARGIL